MTGVAWEHKKRFEQDLRDAFDFLCDAYGSEWEKGLKETFGLWGNEYKTFHMQAIEPVVHIQDNVRYEKGGSRMLRWTTYPDRDEISIRDVFLPNNGARSFYSTLHLVLKPTETGIKTVGRWGTQGPEWDWIMMEDDATMTYQGHPVDTGDQVVALLRHMDMACMQMVC